MKKVIITRTFANDKQTIGQLNVVENKRVVYSCATLELPYVQNTPRISCIPKGTYTVRKRVSPKFGESFIFENVQGRSFILIHAGNFHRDILGCILVGRSLQHIDADGYIDVSSSRKAMEDLLAVLPDEFDCEIV